LNVFNGIKKFLYTIPDELGRGINTVFFESLQIAESAVFIKKRVLVIRTLPGRSLTRRDFEALQFGFCALVRVMMGPLRAIFKSV